MKRSIFRRGTLTLVPALLILAACAPAAPPAPTQAPAKPAAPAAQPTAATKPAAPAAQPTAAAKPAGQSQASAPGVPPPPAKVEKVKWGILARKADTAFQFMAQDKGFFKEFGVDVEFVEFQSSALQQKALIAGELDLAENEIAGPIAAIEQGAGKFKVLGSMNPGLPHALFVNKDINSVNDLKGKRIAHSGVGGLPHVAALAILQKYGISDKDVTWLNAGNEAQRVQAIIAGKADAAVSSIEFKIEAEKAGNTKPLLRVSETIPEYIRLGTLAPEKAVNEREDALVRAIAAMMKGVRYAMDNPDETTASAAKITKRQPDELAWFIKDMIDTKQYDPNFGIAPSAVDFMQKINISVDRQKNVIPSNQIIDTKIRQKVLDLIGEYKPGALKK